MLHEAVCRTLQISISFYTVPNREPVSARSDAGILGSNPIKGMDVCLCLFCVCFR
jgi:hypothetical protein